MNTKPTKNKKVLYISPKLKAVKLCTCNKICNISADGDKLPEYFDDGEL